MTTIVVGCAWLARMRSVGGLRRQFGKPLPISFSTRRLARLEAIGLVDANQLLQQRQASLADLACDELGNVGNLAAQPDGFKSIGHFVDPKCDPDRFGSKQPDVAPRHIPKPSAKRGRTMTPARPPERWKRERRPRDLDRREYRLPNQRRATIQRAVNPVGTYTSGRRNRSSGCCRRPRW